ncbi:SLC13 family permease [Arthrobacter ginkgonis]|uniref:SLC13 family permease n=1 Tax=Arthrobacter ginkgonis TaxID=1630594 RepID=A0ABP7CBJ9_9MICC
MSISLLSILILAAMFLIATVLPVNMGALALGGAFVLGVLVMGLSPSEVFAGFPGSLFLTIVGVTYLFAIARNNGTIDKLVQGAVRLMGERTALIPWIMFGITATITAVGALSPAAVAIIAPIALSFAGRYKINPLLMGMMVVHGAQGGGFSPIAVYGVTVNTIVAEAGLDVSPTLVFLSSLVFNVLICVVLFIVFGGSKLRGGHVEEFATAVSEARLKVSAGAKAATDVAYKGTGSGMYGPRDPAGDGTESVKNTPFTFAQISTVLGLIALAVVALGFKMDIGFVSITIAVILALISPNAQKGAINKISWSTVLLLCGMLTFVGVLEEAGTIEYVSNGVAGIGIPLLAALLICYIGAIVSAFASSTAILAALIPLAVPFLASGQIGAAGVICALAVASTIVDASPFSTNGALVLANAPEGVDKDRFYRQILIYSGIIIVVVPMVAWAAMVLPGWM